MRKKPEILKTLTLAKTRLFRIEQLELRFSNGVETRYERLVGSSAGAVLIVPMPDPDTVLLISEYAAGVDRYEVAFPKGRIEPGEDILAAANRELMEEVGYGAQDLHLLTSLSLAPGYFGHYTHIVLARGLYPERLTGDEPEEITVLPWPMQRMDELMERSDFTEARSIAALFLAREYMGHGGD